MTSTKDGLHLLAGPQQPYTTAPAAAELARTRIDRLKLEFKANEKNQAVKLGSYEQNIGLKRDRSTL